MRGRPSRAAVVATHAVVAGRTDLPRWAPTAALGLALSTATVAALLAAGSASGIGVRPVADTLCVVATALFFGAGMLRLTRWTVTGEAYAAASAAALLVFAVSCVPLALAARAMVATSAASVPGSLARLAAVGVVAAILAPVLGLVRRDRARPPARLTAAGLSVTLAVFALAVVADRLQPAFAASVRAAAALDAGAAVLWLALAGLTLRAGQHERAVSARWSALTMVLVGTAGLVRAGEAETGSWSWSVAAGSLLLLAGLVSIANAALDARESLSAQDLALRDAGDALVAAEEVLSTVECRRADLVHDARSMIYALRGALVALDGATGAASPAESARLREAMDAELGRLVRLIEGAQGAGADTPVEVDVAEVLEPLAETAARSGVAVDCRVGGLVATARPDDLAEIVANLLANARRHAPGSPVWVSGEQGAGRVLVVVDDAGPGIPEPLWDSVFERGQGYGPAAGTGLGLEVARRLARGLGGDLTATTRPGGGARLVLSLPSGGEPR